MARRGIIALGISQCVNWGVLYYAFAVLVLPVQLELGVSTWVVTGAFSLALLMSALLAPRVGAWCDRDRGSVVMQAGGFAAAALLVTWTFVPGVAMLYIVWAGLGACMAATLYEPAFVIVGRAFEDPTQRLRALAAVTLFGGLASTIFLPLTAFLVATFGWRGAALALAVAMIGSTAATRRFVARSSHPATSGGHSTRATRPAQADRETDPPRLLLITSMFALASLASAAFSANLVPTLSERGISPTGAAVLGGLIGVMQLPGRALLMNGTLGGTPATLITLSLALHAAGLCTVAFAPSMVVAAAGTAIFALGSGLTTLVRPHLMQSIVSDARGGYLNGRIAQYQQLARAAGPLAVAWIAGIVGYGPVFAATAALFVIVGIASQGSLGSVNQFDLRTRQCEAK